nr:G2/M phase-specific E3 ubiquitin-protein ligase-like [Misgurnus anguillicaudatus]XP_055049229.1 G2/M phase-specific E3 ubiquitin-protein ligase-like [Misgurnus anguillicaudatus]
MIQSAQNVPDAQKAIMTASEELLGSLRHIQALEDRDDLVHAALNFLLESRLRDSLEQFQEGLQCLGLIQDLQKNPSLFRVVLMFEEKPLTARDLADLFVPQLSPLGTNKRELESKIICYWRDWLLDVEEGASSPLSLKNILAFASGSTEISRLGFPVDPTLEFLHQQESETPKIFPEANTCRFCLRLPIHNNYEAFVEFMRSGILQAPTFGVI